MISDGLVLGLLAVAAMSLVAWRTRSLPMMLLSSVGMIAASLLVYQETEAILPTAVIFALAFAQIALIKEGRDIARPSTRLRLHG